MNRYPFNHHVAWLKLPILMFLALFMTGCVVKDIRDSSNQERDAYERHQQEIEDGEAVRDSQFSNGGIIRREAPFLVAREIPVHQQSLPPEFAENIKYRSSSPQTPGEIVETIASMTGLSFEIRDIEGSQDDKNDERNQQAQQEPQQQTMPILPGLGGQVPLGFMPQQQTPSLTASATQRRLLFRFDGRLADMLDDIAGQLDASWRYDEIRERVILYRFEARVIELSLPSQRRQVTSSIGISGQGTGGVNISSNATIDPWTSIMGGLEAILNRNQAFQDDDDEGGSNRQEEGALNENDIIQSRVGSVAANRDLSQIFVLARPDVVKEIADYIEQTNRRFARNVLIDVRLVEIQAGNDAEFAVDFSGTLMDNLSGNRGISIGAVSPGQTMSSGFRVSASTGSRLEMDVFLGMLSQVSRATLANQAQIIAINGQPAPFQQVTSIPFVRSTTSTLGGDGVSQLSAETDEVNVGFTANFIPMVLDGNRVMLQYQIESSNVLGFEELANGLARIPRVSRQSLQQQAYLNNGDIIVLFGYEQQRSNRTRQRSIFSQRNAIDNERIMTAMVIQVSVEGS